MSNSQQNGSNGPTNRSMGPDPIRGDEIPDELWENLEHCFPDNKMTLRKIRHHLLDCRSDYINANTGLLLLIAALFIKYFRTLHALQTRSNLQSPPSEVAELKNLLIQRFGNESTTEIDGVIAALNGQWTAHLQAFLKLGILLLKALPAQGGRESENLIQHEEQHEPIGNPNVKPPIGPAHFNLSQQDHQNLFEFIETLEPKLAAIENQLRFFQTIEAQKIFFVASNQGRPPKGPQIFDVETLANLVAKYLENANKPWWSKSFYTIPIGAWIVIVMLLLNLILPVFNFIYQVF